MADVAPSTHRNLRHAGNALSLPPLPRLTFGAVAPLSLSSSVAISPKGSALELLRQHCDDLIQASSTSLTQCGALQCTAFKLGTAFVHAAVSLADLFAPAGLAASVQPVIEELCTHLTALQAETEVISARVNKLAAAHCEYTSELQKFVLSLSPTASF
eukprot:5221143-Amphidinium_carterae.1